MKDTTLNKFVAKAAAQRSRAGRVVATRRFALLRIVAAMLSLLAVSLAMGAQDVSKEYQVQAVFLWRLAQFVTWPEDAFENRESPIVIGVIGKDPFGPALKLATEGETAHERKVEVRPVRNANDAARCHILYVSASEDTRVENVIAGLRARPVLTVSEIEDFANRRGGMVRFRNEQGKVKLRINIDNVRAAKLTLDARLLRVAEPVRNP